MNMIFKTNLKLVKIRFLRGFVWYVGAGIAQSV
jgi:hypothetical protein